MSRESKALIPVAEYIRMSTDKQEASPERQHAENEKLCTRSGYKIVATYQDDGMTGTESKNRGDFQQMLKDAKSRKFRIVVMSEQSRMSREDVFTVMGHWQQLKEAGVSIATTARGLIDFNNMGNVITAIIDQYGAHDESRKIANRTVTGKRLRLSKGMRLTAKVYGYDRELINEQGQVATVVKYNENFRKPPTWTQRLVVSSDAEQVGHVKFLFDKLCAGWSLFRIGGELRKRGRKFDLKHLRYIATNPVYCGDTRIGHRAVGKFEHLVESEQVTRDTHPPIVSREKFERAQAVLAKLPKFVRAKRLAATAKLLLTGLLRCNCCKSRANGRLIPAAKPGRNVFYHCSATSSYGAGACKKPLGVGAWVIESAVVKEVLRVLTSRAAEAGVKRSLRSKGAKANAVAIGIESKLANLRDKINKAKRNLALADPEFVKDIQGQITEWMSQERILDQQLADVQHTETLKPEAQKAIANFATYRDQILERADRDQLRLALQATVFAVYAERQRIRGSRRKETHIEIVFQPGLGLDSIKTVIQDEEKTLWERLVEHLISIHPQTETLEGLVGLGLTVFGRDPSKKTGVYAGIKKARERGLVEVAFKRKGKCQFMTCKASRKAIKTF